MVHSPYVQATAAAPSSYNKRLLVARRSSSGGESSDGGGGLYDPPISPNSICKEKISRKDEFFAAPDTDYLFYFRSNDEDVDDTHDYQEDDDVVDDSPSLRELPSPSRPLYRTSSLSQSPIDLGIPDLSPKHKEDDDAEEQISISMEDQWTIRRSLAWSTNSMDEGDDNEEQVMYSSHDMDYTSCFQRYHSVLEKIEEDDDISVACDESSNNITSLYWNDNLDLSTKTTTQTELPSSSADGPFWQQIFIPHNVYNKC